MDMMMISPQQRRNYVRSSVLVLLAFYTCFFSRALTSLGGPVALNFLHFLTVPVACVLAISQTRTKDVTQIRATQRLILALGIMFTCIVASALLNSAGLINVVLDFLLLCEPALLLLAIISLPMSTQSVQWFRSGIILAGSLNLIIAFVQRYILRYDLTIEAGGWDMIQGIFFYSGAGHVVSASVSMTFACFYLASAKTRPLWFRIGVVLAAIGQVIISDTKQIFLAFFVALILIALLQVRNPIRIVQYLSLFAVAVLALYTIVQLNLYSTTELAYWLSDDNLLISGFELKFSIFSIVTSAYQSMLNLIIGLGPGHTVGRLGGWMIRDYASLLTPLGVTSTTIGHDLWLFVGSHPLGDKSSMWSPFFGWAGIWGDLGLAGLAAYLFMGFLVWRDFCKDDTSRFLLLTVFVFGAIFTQMEEPAYMMFLTSVLGIRWHENRIEAERSRSPVYREPLHVLQFEPNRENREKLEKREEQAVPKDVELLDPWDF